MEEVVKSIVVEVVIEAGLNAELPGTISFRVNIPKIWMADAGPGAPFEN